MAYAAPVKKLSIPGNYSHPSENHRFNSLMRRLRESAQASAEQYNERMAQAAGLNLDTISEPAIVLQAPRPRRMSDADKITFFYSHGRWPSDAEQRH